MIFKNLNYNLFLIESDNFNSTALLYLKKKKKCWNKNFIFENFVKCFESNHLCNKKLSRMFYLPLTIKEKTRLFYYFCLVRHKTKYSKIKRMKFGWIQYFLVYFKVIYTIFYLTLFFRIIIFIWKDFSFPLKRQML